MDAGIVAIAVALVTALGSVFTYVSSARSKDVEILRGIIAELRKQVEELQEENADLKAWAECLVCQVKEAGRQPAEFMRHRAKQSE